MMPVPSKPWLAENRFRWLTCCLDLIKDLYENSGSFYGAIVKEINARVGDFAACKFIHESRRRNFEAHSLAKFSLSLEFGRHVWPMEPHDIVTVPMNLVEQYKSMLFSKITY